MAKSSQFSPQQIAMVVGAVAVLVLSGLWLRQTVSAPAESAAREAYFYDLTSGTVFTALAAQMPPIDAPGGAGQGVRAYAYGCGGCSDAQRKVVYLETFTKDAIQFLNDPVAGMAPDTVERGTLAAIPPETPGGEVEWFNGLTSQYPQIISQYEYMCDGKPAIPCTPAQSKTP